MHLSKLFYKQYEISSPGRDYLQTIKLPVIARTRMNMISLLVNTNESHSSVVDQDAILISVSTLELILSVFVNLEINLLTYPVPSTHNSNHTYSLT